VLRAAVVADGFFFDRRSRSALVPRALVVRVRETRDRGVLADRGRPDGVSVREVKNQARRASEVDRVVDLLACDQLVRSCVARP